MNTLKIIFSLGVILLNGCQTEKMEKKGAHALEMD